MEQPIRSKSRKVNRYVRDVLAYRSLMDRWAAKLTKLEPLKQKVRAKGNQVTTRRAALTGGQLAEAERLIHARAVERSPLSGGEIDDERAGDTGIA